MIRLIFVFTITYILSSCSNPANKDAAKSEATPIDSVRSIQELPSHHDTVTGIREVEEMEKPTSTKSEVTVPKQDVPKTAEQIKSQVKEYAIQKPVKSINKDVLINKSNDFKEITHTKSPTSEIQHSKPPPPPPPPAVVNLPPQHTTEAYNEQVLSVDTVAIGAEKSSAEPTASPLPENAVPKKKSARLAYNYSSEMKRDVSEDINVYVSIVNSSSFVKDALMKIVAQQKDPNKHKTNADSIVCANILLYKRIKVELIDPESSFKIDTVFGNAWQDVDSIGDNRWRWSVIPLTNHPTAKLVIKVIAKTPSGVIEDIDDRTFYIKVKMTGPFQMFRTWWIYLQDHPELFLTVIIIPMIAFFGKRYFDRKSKNKNP